MTLDDRQSLIGRLTIEKDLIEKQLRALVTEAQAISPVCDHMGFILRSPLTIPADLEFSINAMPEPSRLREIFVGIKAKEERQSQIERELANNGLGEQ